MTREALKKHWDVIVAFKDGAGVQFKNIYNGEWDDLNQPFFDLDGEYRIKPKTEYVPFDHSDDKFLVGKVVRHKLDKSTCIITSCTKEYVSVAGVIMNYERLFEFTFLDGSPCGKLKL